jgi:hypothetical protein
MLIDKLIKGTRFHLILSFSLLDISLIGKRPSCQ